MPATKKPPLTVAYFTMEVGIASEIPTFAGGLGILAMDLLRSCAELAVPAVGVTICWRRGSLKQRIDLDGSQHYEEVPWDPAQHLQRLEETVSIEIEGRPVTVGVWQYDIEGSLHTVPLYFLDTNLESNAPEDRAITSELYGGDGRMRLKQEAVLGIGGVRMLRALGYLDIGTFHLNEGHCALALLELLRERGYRDEAVRPSCVFTTHTPVAAGHDVFDYDLAHQVVGNMLPWHIRSLAGQERLSMTHLAMHLSHVSFGVSRVHAEVSRHLFRGEPIDYVTNGAHHVRWAAAELQKLFDRSAPGWRDDPQCLEEHCRNLPDEALWEAHRRAKARLIAEVNRHTVDTFDAETLTIASARRVVAYKRPELLYTNLERLMEIGCGKLQIIHAGNAHPADVFGQEVIRRMIERSRMLKDCMRIVYLPNYTPELAALLTQGADVWLNTPMRLHEASGTSGMKACLNGVLNLSTLDGWWIEGYEKDPEAGWRIGPLAPALGPEEHRAIDAEDLYTQLQYEVIPEYTYKDRARWLRRMKRAIGLIGHFNTHRAVREYLEKAWKFSTSTQFPNPRSHQ
jgi:starch phosphorylase